MTVLFNYLISLFFTSLKLILCMIFFFKVKFSWPSFPPFFFFFNGAGLSCYILGSIILLILRVFT